MTSIVVLAVAAFTVIAALVGVLVWAVRRGDAMAGALITAREQVEAESRRANVLQVQMERARFEAEKATDALAHERARANALEEYVSTEAMETDDEADLDPDDLAGRLVRFSRRWKTAVPGAATAGDPLRAGQAPPVHPGASTETP